MRLANIDKIRTIYINDRTPREVKIQHIFLETSLLFVFGILQRINNLIFLIQIMH